MAEMMNYYGTFKCVFHKFSTNYVNFVYAAAAAVIGRTRAL